MKYLVMLLFAIPVAASQPKHDAALCRALENDNYIIVMSKLKKDQSKTLDEAYKSFTCHGEELIDVAKPKTRNRLIRELDYLTLTGAKKHGKNRT